MPLNLRCPIIAPQNHYKSGVLALLTLSLLLLPFGVPAEDGALTGTKPFSAEGDLSAQMVAGADRFLMREIERSVEQRPKLWQRDFSSPDAYEKSIQPNRERFRQAIGA